MVMEDDELMLVSGEASQPSQKAAAVTSATVLKNLSKLVALIMEIMVSPWPTSQLLYAIP